MRQQEIQAKMQMEQQKQQLEYQMHQEKLETDILVAARKGTQNCQSTQDYVINLPHTTLNVKTLFLL